MEPFPVVYGLPDGGRVTVTDPELVALGDRLTRRQVTYEHPGGADRPACRAVFEVRGGEPVCTSLQLTVPAGGGAIRSKHLKAVHLDDLCGDAFAATGAWTENPAGGHVRALRGLDHDRDVIDNARTRRTAITPELLQRVAAVYRDLPADTNRGKAIAAAFNVGERHAYRLIKATREAGHLK